VQYEFSSKALEDIKKLPKAVQARVIEKCDFIFENNLLVSHSRPLSGKRGCSRIRIGDYRVIFHIPKPGVAVVIKVAHRKEVYKL